MTIYYMHIFKWTVPAQEILFSIINLQEHVPID